jgi:Putative Actinobacterial Holin-X, holin superfamily III
MRDRCTSRAGERSADLLGALARQLSALVRRDIEVSAAERLPVVRRTLLDVAAVWVVAVAGLFALAAASVAGSRAAAALVPTWGAALIVAGVWTVIALLAAVILLRPRTQSERDELIGLLQILARDHELDALQASREDARDEAEAEMRQTARTLVATLLHEVTEHQVRSLPAVAKREVGKAEADVTQLVAETISLIAAPARGGQDPRLALRADGHEDASETRTDDVDPGSSCARPAAAECAAGAAERAWRNAGREWR